MKLHGMAPRIVLIALSLAAAGAPAMAAECIAHESAAGGLVADCSEDARRSLRAPGEVKPVDDEQGERELRRKVRRIEAPERERTEDATRHGRLEFEHGEADRERR